MPSPNKLSSKGASPTSKVIENQAHKRPERFKIVVAESYWVGDAPLELWIEQGYAFPTNGDAPLELKYHIFPPLARQARKIFL